MHKVLSGHLATCKQNCGAKYGSLQTCFRNLQFSNEKVQLVFENGKIIWTNTLNGLELTSFEIFFHENKHAPMLIQHIKLLIHNDLTIKK